AGRQLTGGTGPVKPMSLVGFDPLLHIAESQGIATTCIAVTGYKTVYLDIDDMVSAVSKIVGITRPTFHQPIAHPVELPPKAILQNFFRIRHSWPHAWTDAKTYTTGDAARKAASYARSATAPTK